MFFTPYDRYGNILRCWTATLAIPTISVRLRDGSICGRQYEGSDIFCSTWQLRLRRGGSTSPMARRHLILASSVRVRDS